MPLTARRRLTMPTSSCCGGSLPDKIALRGHARRAGIRIHSDGAVGQASPLDRPLNAPVGRERRAPPKFPRRTHDCEIELDLSSFGEILLYARIRYGGNMERGHTTSSRQMSVHDPNSLLLHPITCMRWV